MIGLDTNVVIRYLTQDDPKQSLQASRLIESLTVEEPGFVGIVSVIEVVWILTACYGATRETISDVLGTLLQVRGIVVAHADVVLQALRVFRQGKADFADCLIKCIADQAMCTCVMTFDRDAAKHCGMQLLS